MANTYVDYTATAGQTDFNFSFPYLENDHVEVFIDGVESTAFTISLSPTRIVLDTAATGGETIRVRRSSDPTEDLVDFVNGSILTESDLDRAYLHNRYLNEEAYEGNTSSLQTAAGSTNFDANFNKIINLSPPTNALDAANKNYVDDKLALSGTSLSGFNKSTHTGDNATTTFTLSFTPQTGTAAAFRVAIDGVLQTPDDAYTVDSGASTITFTSAPPTNAEIVVIATGTAQDVNSIGVTATGSTTARSLADRFADVVNVLDYGATGDGVTDDRTAINAAFTAIANAGGGTIFFPKGTYNISDYIGNTTSPTAQISVSVVGEKGTVINCNPTASANYALYLAYADLEHCFVSGLKVNGNNKTRRGIYVRATSGSFREAVVENCDVLNINIVNGVTGSGSGISISSSAWSYRALVHNCSVYNVSRDWWDGGEVTAGNFQVGKTYTITTTGTTDFTLIGASNSTPGTTFTATGAGTGTGTAEKIGGEYLEGIVVTDTELCSIDRCAVNNVDWNGNQAQDADAIKIFSEQDGTGDYYKSVISVTNCIIENGYGRLVKLQTEGNTFIQNNMFVLNGSGELITNWKAIDSQVGDANIVDNRFYIGDSWTGGTSANLIQLQQATSANFNYNFETFTQKFKNNVVEVKKKMSYGVILSVPPINTPIKQYVEICDNVISHTGDELDGTTQTETAFSQFVYTAAWNDPASVTGEYYWKINNNQIHTFYFIRFTGTQYDYTGKLFIEVVNNVKFSVGYSGALFYLGNTTGAYTSNIKISDNQIGQNQGGAFNWISDPTKWSNGCDFPEGDSTAGAISNMPANYRNGRIYKRGGVLGVETVSGSTVYKYISTDNGTTWYQV